MRRFWIKISRWRWITSRGYSKNAPVRLRNTPNFDTNILHEGIYHLSTQSGTEAKFKRFFGAPPLALKTFSTDFAIIAGLVFLYPKHHSPKKKKFSISKFFGGGGGGTLFFFFFFSPFMKILVKVFSFVLFVYQMRSLLLLMRRKSEDISINAEEMTINVTLITINTEEIRL